MPCFLAWAMQTWQQDEDGGYSDICDAVETAGKFLKHAYQAWPRFGHGLAAMRCHMSGFLAGAMQMWQKDANSGQSIVCDAACKGPKYA